MRQWIVGGVLAVALGLLTALLRQGGETPARAQGPVSASGGSVTARAGATAPSSAAPPEAFGSECGFLGAEEGSVRRSLASAPIAAVEKGRGGRSLAFKLRLEDGTVGYFKPEQGFSAAHWYSELASYYLDRELGLGRVPPTVGRRFAWEPLRAAAGRDERVPEITVAADGTVRGAISFWVPGGLDALRMGHGWERWVRIDRGLSLNPFVRPRDYRAQQRGEEVVVDGAERPEATRPDRPDRPAELSDLIVFDYLTQNVDRWGGDFTNVRTRSDGALVFLDNGAGFWPREQRNGIMEARLQALQRFRRSTVEALRRFDLARYERRLAADPLAPILSETQLEGLRERVGVVLAHVEAMRARFGDARALPW